MSLPAIFSRPDATNYALTVAPYLPSLYHLPQKTLAVISSPKGLVELYISTNPLVSATAFSLFIVPILYVAQEVNKNYSQVDRVWSILPAVYNVHYAVYAHLADLPTQQADALAAISVLWSVGLILLVFHRWDRKLPDPCNHNSCIYYFFRWFQDLSLP